MSDTLIITLTGFAPRSWALDGDLDRQASDSVRWLFNFADERTSRLPISLVAPQGAGVWRMTALDSMIETVVSGFDAGVAAALASGASGDLALARTLGPLHWTWRIKTSRQQRASNPIAVQGT